MLKTSSDFLLVFYLLWSRTSLKMRHTSKTNKGTFGDVCALNTHPLHFRFNWGVFAKGSGRDHLKAIVAHSLLYTVQNKSKTQSSLPEIKEIQSLCTADAAGLLSLFSWALQDAASDMPSLKVNKNKEDCGTRDVLQCSVQLLEPWTRLRHNSRFYMGLWGHGVHQWNRTVGIWVTWPTQVSSHEARVTHVELARCDFQASSGVWTDWSVFRCRFRLRSKFNAGAFRCLSCSFAQVLSFREHL